MAKPAAETIDRICAMARAGQSRIRIGEALGLTRNQVAGILHRLRLAGDPRVPPAGRGVALRSEDLLDDRKAALADAWAEGAPIMADAARAAGIPLPVARDVWAAIKADLGWQAR